MRRYLHFHKIMNLPHSISKTDLRKIPENSGATKYKVALEF